MNSMEQFRPRQPEEPSRPPQAPRVSSPTHPPKAIHPQTTTHAEADLAPPHGDIAPSPTTTTPAIRQHLGGLIRMAEGTPDKLAREVRPDSTTEDDTRSPQIGEQNDEPSATPAPADTDRELSGHTPLAAPSEHPPKLSEAGGPPEPPEPPHNSAPASPEEEDPVGYSSVPFNPESFPQADNETRISQHVKVQSNHLVSSYTDYAEDSQVKPENGGPEDPYYSLNLQCQLPNGVALSRVTDMGEVEVTILPHNKQEQPLKYRYEAVEPLDAAEDGYTLLKTRIDTETNTPLEPSSIVGQLESDQLAHMLGQSEPEHVSLQQITEFHDRQVRSPEPMPFHETGAGASELFTVVERELNRRPEEESATFGSVSWAVPKTQPRDAAITVTVGETKPLPDPQSIGPVLPSATVEMQVTSVGQEPISYIRVEATHKPDSQFLAANQQAYGGIPLANLEQQTTFIYQTKGRALLIIQQRFMTRGGQRIGAVETTQRYGTYADAADIRNFIRQPTHRTPQDAWRARHKREM